MSEQRRWHVEAEHFRSPEVDHKLKLGRLFDFLFGGALIWNSTRTCQVGVYHRLKIVFAGVGG
jgi:hypothetical protein